MIDFQRIDLTQKDQYNTFLQNCGDRGCEYSLVNLYLWGRQQVAFLEGFLVLFSQFERSSVYPFPIGKGDVKKVLDAILHDAEKRGLACRLTSMTAADCAMVEELYPDQFRFHMDRDGCDYVYDIRALAELPGRKYQRKRNHVNRFRQLHPDCRMVPIDRDTLPAVESMVSIWYESRQTSESQDDAYMERLALRRAFAQLEVLGLEGIALMEGDRVIAMTMGSFLNESTFDVHFEKALYDEDGTYCTINQLFAAHLREKYPQLQYLNREDDLGIPGLRQAKLSYHPDHLVAKFWANLREDDDEH